MVLVVPSLNSISNIVSSKTEVSSKVSNTSPGSGIQIGDSSELALKQSRSFKDLLEPNSDRISSDQVKPDQIIKQLINDYSRDFILAEKKVNALTGKLKPDLKNIFELHQNINRFSLQTQIVERLAEAFSSSIKSLQKAGA